MLKKRGGERFMPDGLNPIPIFQTDFMRWIVLLIIADWVLGVVVSLVRRNFKLAKLAYYLHDAVLPYVFVFAVVNVLALAQPDLALVVPVTFVLIVLALVGNMVANLEKLGMPVPKFLKKE